MENQNDFAEFRKLVQEYDTAMMTTIGRDGHLHSRPMATQEPLESSPLWFATSLDTNKVEDLQKDPRINLSYYRPSDRAWVSVSGKARIDQDRTKIKALWKEDWKIWFPGGPEQPDLALLHVDAESVTFWQPESGKIGTLFSLAKAYVKGQEPDIKPPVTVSVK